MGTYQDCQKNLGYSEGKSNTFVLFHEAAFGEAEAWAGKNTKKSYISLRVNLKKIKNFGNAL